MKKQFTKLFSFLLVATLLVISSIPFASAATLLDESKTVSISMTCNKPGYTFEVFQVASLESTSTSPYETKYNAFIPEIEDAIKSGTTSEILSILDGMSTLPSTAVSQGTWKTSATSTSKTFSNLAQGIYYVKALSYPAGVKSVTNSVVALPYYNNGWVYDISEIDLATKVLDGSAKTEKEITNSTKNNVNYTDVSLGDTVNFILKNTTAGSSDMKLTTYTVYDNMSAGLTLNNNSFSVYLADKDENKLGNNLTADDYDVNITQQADGENTLFNVSLTKEYLAKEDFYASNVTYVMVTYTANLNKHAVVGTAGNPNEDVKLEYGNDKSVESVEGNTVYVYTYALGTNKVDPNGNALKGAEFKLYKTEADAKTQTDEIASGTSDSNGKVLYYNSKGEEMRVQSGDYYIVETKAPVGYSLYGKVIKISVAATYSDTLTNGTYVTNCPKDGYATVDVTNVSITAPQTGGIGSTIFYVTGSIVLAASAVLFFVSRKKKKSN